MGCRAVPIAQIPQPGTGSSSPGGYGGPSSSMTLPFASIGSVCRCWSGTVFPNSSLDWHGAAATQPGGGLTYRIRLSVAIMQLLIGTDGRRRSLLSGGAINGVAGRRPGWEHASPGPPAGLLFPGTKPRISTPGLKPASGLIAQTGRSRCSRRRLRYYLLRLSFRIMLSARRACLRRVNHLAARDDAARKFESPRYRSCSAEVAGRKGAA